MRRNFGSVRKRRATCALQWTGNCMSCVCVTFSVVNMMPCSPCWTQGSIRSSIRLTSDPKFLILRAEKIIRCYHHHHRHHHNMCVSVWWGWPCTQHHIEEDGEQVVHGPQEVLLQQRLNLLRDLLEGELDHLQLVRRGERCAADTTRKLDLKDSDLLCFYLILFLRVPLP